MKRLGCGTCDIHFSHRKKHVFERGPPTIRGSWERNNISYHATYWQLLTKGILPTKHKVVHRCSEAHKIGYIQNPVSRVQIEKVFTTRVFQKLIFFWNFDFLTNFP